MAASISAAWLGKRGGGRPGRVGRWQRRTPLGRSSPGGAGAGTGTGLPSGRLGGKRQVAFCPRLLPAGQPAGAARGCPGLAFLVGGRGRPPRVAQHLRSEPAGSVSSTEVILHAGQPAEAPGWGVMSGGDCWGGHLGISKAQGTWRCWAARCARQRCAFLGEPGSFPVAAALTCLKCGVG